MNRKHYIFATILILAIISIIVYRNSESNLQTTSLEKETIHTNENQTENTEKKEINNANEETIYFLYSNPFIKNTFVISTSNEMTSIDRNIG